MSGVLGDRMKQNGESVHLFGLPARARGGFTLVEVLIAATIMVIALFGILGTAFSALKHAAGPENVQQSIKLGQERLDYFRSQPNPYLAAGGTYYEPSPGGPRSYLPDYSRPPAGNGVNIVFNNGPSLFVREYLFGFDEHRSGSTNNGTNMVDNGRTLAENRSRVAAQGAPGAARNYGPNEIPPQALTVYTGGTIPDTPVDGIVPNPEDNAKWSGDSTYVDKGVAVGATGGVTKYFTFAQRANDGIRATAGGATCPDAVKFVREVWVQTNNPNFTTDECPQIGVTLEGAGLGNQGGIQAFQPPQIKNLPPYVVAVTVRVFARDKQTKQISLADAGMDGARARVRLIPEATGIVGPGYDRQHPLVTMVGYYGLRR